jgi:hypothetical protein
VAFVVKERLAVEAGNTDTVTNLSKRSLKTMA